MKKGRPLFVVASSGTVRRDVASQTVFSSHRFSSPRCTFFDRKNPKEEVAFYLKPSLRKFQYHKNERFSRLKNVPALYVVSQFSEEFQEGTQLGRGAVCIKNGKKWASAVSEQVSLELAVREVCDRIEQLMGGTKADFGFLFISDTFSSEYPRLLPLIENRLEIKHLIGCSGGGVIGCDATGYPQEFETKPALSLTVAQLPGVEIEPFQIYSRPESRDLPDLDQGPNQWIELFGGVPPEKNPNFILFVDPTYSNMNDLLLGMDFAYPNRPKVGGVCSYADGSSALFLSNQLRRQGVVGLALHGDITVDTIVAQGCRPIGRSVSVTGASRNIILALEDRPALDVVQDIVTGLSDTDRQLAAHSLFVGLVHDPFQDNPKSGDFLIRNLIGVDPAYGALAVGASIRSGQRVQFHIRDSSASREDLRTLLSNYEPTAPEGQIGAPPVGILMVSCMGRGEGLYGVKNHDSGLVRAYLPDIPITGFFANGEIGPIGKSTYLHGYTSVFAIFR